MTINITPSVVVEGLQALVAKEGEEFVYSPVPDEDHGTKCVYVLDDRPSCIVGQFLANLGVPVERLKQADTASYGAGIPATTLLIDLRAEGVITFDNTDGRILSALNGAQYNQDIGKAWGYAFTEAKRVIERGF